MNVVIADSHPLTRIGVEHVLASAFESVCPNVLHAGNISELHKALERKSCDLLICEYSMPGASADGLTLLRMIRQRFPGLPIVLFTMVNVPEVVVSAVVRMGIDCMVSKADHVDHLLNGLRSALMGHSYASPVFAPHGASDTHTLATTTSIRLTPKEAEVIRLYTSGHSIKQIAASLHRSKQTVSAQKRAAQKKLGAPCDGDLFRWSVQYIHLAEGRD